MTEYLGRVVTEAHIDNDSYVAVDVSGQVIRVKRSDLIITKEDDGYEHAYYPPLA